MAVAVLRQEGVDSQALAESLNIPLIDHAQGFADYLLLWEENQWVVKKPSEGQNFVIRLDFDCEIERLKKQKVSPKKDLLCKALGFKNQSPFRVVDGTLGLAKDSCHLLSFGIQVVGFESNAVAHLLVQSALQNSSISQEQMCIFHQDSLLGLETLDPIVDAVYLDPMFENIKQKSAPKKSLAFLREVVEGQVDVPNVIHKSLDLGVKRVVVKRPINGEHLYKVPDIIFKGKMIRYDVYTRSGNF